MASGFEGTVGARFRVDTQRSLLRCTKLLDTMHLSPPPPPLVDSGPDHIPGLFSFKRGIRDAPLSSLAAPDGSEPPWRGHLYLAKRGHYYLALTRSAASLTVTLPGRYTNGLTSRKAGEDHPVSRT